jgi:hypothetical protein
VFNYFGNINENTCLSLHEMAENKVVNEAVNHEEDQGMHGHGVLGHNTGREGALLNCVMGGVLQEGRECHKEAREEKDSEHSCGEQQGEETLGEERHLVGVVVVVLITIRNVLISMLCIHTYTPMTS